MTQLTISVRRELVAPIADVWRVIDDTARCAEWVVGALAVTGHHGSATVGKVYTERNRTVGPLTTASTWTVQEVAAPTLRIDSGSGFDPLHDMVNTFRLEPLGDDATMMTYQVDCRIGLGILGRIIAPLLTRVLRAEFSRSMAQLEIVVRAELAIERAGDR